MKSFNSKKIVGIVVVVLVAILIIVIGGLYYSRSLNSSTIKIGGLYPLTGGLASYGEPAQNTALIAVDDINANGGIGGKKLELISEDHKCDPKVMATAFDKLISVDSIHIFNSIACTGTVVAIAPNFEARDVVMIGTVTSGNKLTGISPNFFRNWASDGQEAKLLADQVIQKGYKNVAVIYEETDYAKWRTCTDTDGTIEI